MDYLTVPDMSSLSQVEKAMPKDDQAQVSSLGSPGPLPNQVSGISLAIPLTQEQSTVMSITMGTSSVNSKRSSRINKPRRASRATHSTVRSKVTAKEVRHHRKRKRRRLTLKELLTRSWQKSHPYLILLRKIIDDFTRSIFFDVFICTVVAINTILLVAQTFALVEIRGEWFFSALDPIFLSIYVVEAVLKLIALQLDYFHDPWNDIDFFIVIMTLLDFMMPLFISVRQGNRGNTVTMFRILKVFKGIRAIRAIRFLLTLRVMENLQEVTSTFMLSCQSIGAIIVLMFFMSSVVLRDMFHQADANHFGDLFKTIFTLFQLFTLDDWSLIYLTCRAAGAWYIIIFLVIYILVEYFLLLNLLIAVLVDNFQMALLKRQELKKQKKLIQPKDSSTEEDAATKAAEKAKLKEEEEEEFFRRMVMEKYSGLELKDREWQLLYAYFRLMTAIETNLQQFRSQATTTNKVLDTFFETAEEEYLPQ